MTPPDAPEPAPPSGLQSERQFVDRAVGLYGPRFEQSLRTKGFRDPLFLFHWAAVTTVLHRGGVPRRVLDLGCGPGWSSIFLAGWGLEEVTAVDVSPRMLAIARANAERLGADVSFLEGDIQQLGRLDLEPGYDVVTVLDALHHCADERAVLAGCHRLLRAGGRIVLAEPDWFHTFGRSAAHDRKHFGTTERSMGYRRMRRALRAAGFERIRRHYNVFSVCGRGLSRLGALADTLLTLTIGCPKRPVIVEAVKPKSNPAKG